MSEHDFSAGRRPLTTSDLLTDSTPQRRDETVRDATDADRPRHGVEDDRADDRADGRAEDRAAEDRADDRANDRAGGLGEHERADDAVDVDGAPRSDGHHPGDADTNEPVGRTAPATGEAGSTAVPAETLPTAPNTPGPDEALFGDDEVQGFRNRWRELQADFVDNPRQAVAQADELVAEVIQSLAATFADRKSSLEGRWSSGDEAQTEDLRLALHQYRAFFQKLLAV